MVEKGIRGGICQAIDIHWYSTANNKYMKGYKKKLVCKQFIRMINVSKTTRKTILNGEKTHQSLMRIL